MSADHPIASFPVPEKPRIVIVGAGFGGLTLAKALAKLYADITIIDLSN